VDLVVLVVLVPPQPTTVATQKATTKTARIRFIEVLLGQGGRNREHREGIWDFGFTSKWILR
jgi:hypothetical protein